MLKGLALSVLGTLAWQAGLLVATILAATSSVLAAHTRFSKELALLLWLGGFVLNLAAFYWAFRRARQGTWDGVLLGIMLLVLLALAGLWIMTVASDYHAALGDD